MIYEDEKRKKWELVCHISDEKTPIGQVVLRGEDGRTQLFPATDLVGDGKLPRLLVCNAPNAGNTLAEAIRETLQIIRNTSNIRFLALPVFFTSFGVLAKIYLSPDDKLQDKQLIPALGLGMAFAFLAFETVLSRNLIAWWKAIAAGAAETAWTMTHAHRNEVALWSARLVLFSPYPVALAYWAAKLNWYSTGYLLLDALLVSIPSIVVWCSALYLKKRD